MQNSIAAEAREIVPSAQALRPLNNVLQVVKEPLADCAIKLIENNENYVVFVKIPNLRKEDIRVSVYGNRVVLGTTRQIFGTLKKTVNQTSDNWKAIVENEDIYIIHNFLFDQNIEVARSQATYKNGELELILPKDHRAGKRLLIN